MSIGSYERVQQYNKSTVVVRPSHLGYERVMKPQLKLPLTPRDPDHLIESSTAELGS
jgi:hypothetical protein